MKRSLFRLTLVLTAVVILLAIGGDKTRAIQRLVMALSLSSRETGDVIWTGSTTGANGNVGTRNNPTLADIGLTKARDLRIVVEINEPAGHQVQLTELDLD